MPVSSAVQRRQMPVERRPTFKRPSRGIIPKSEPSGPPSQLPDVERRSKRKEEKKMKCAPRTFSKQ
jgi:hypothetical protein